MAKIDTAMSLTIEQLRSIAADNGIALTGLTAKADIAQAVADGLTAAQLDAAAAALTGGGEAVSETETTPPAAPAEDAPTPADKEVATPMMPASEETIQIKQNPETPTAAQIEAAITEVAVPAKVSVTVGDGDAIELPADVAAQTVQRAVSTIGPALLAQEGHVSSPGSPELTDEEREADAAEYASRYQTA